MPFFSFQQSIWHFFVSLCSGREVNIIVRRLSSQVLWRQVKCCLLLKNVASFSFFNICVRRCLSLLSAGCQQPIDPFTLPSHGSSASKLELTQQQQLCVFCFLYWCFCWAWRSRWPSTGTQCRARLSATMVSWSESCFQVLVLTKSSFPFPLWLFL